MTIKELEYIPTATEQKQEPEHSLFATTTCGWAPSQAADKMSLVALHYSQTSISPRL